jgi:hypothetical protein
LRKFIQIIYTRIINSTALVQIIFPHNPHTCLSICLTGTPRHLSRHRINQVRGLKPGHDGLLNFTVGCESPFTQVLLRWSKEMKITRCQVRAVGMMVQYLPIVAPCGWLCVAWRYRAAIRLLFSATQVVFDELPP